MTGLDLLIPTYLELAGWCGFLFLVLFSPLMRTPGQEALANFKLWIHGRFSLRTATRIQGSVPPAVEAPLELE